VGNDKPRQFTLRFNLQDEAIEAWLSAQPDRGAYLKRLILADKARQGVGSVSPLGARDAAWEERYGMVLEFRERFGRLPFAYEEFRGVKLGRWLEVHAKRDVGRPDRMEKLARIGALDKWERYFGALQAFCEKFGRLPVREDYFGDLPVGAWLFRQKSALRRGELSEERGEKLGALGVAASDWDMKLSLVAAFREECGRLPKFSDTYRGVRIGRWLYAQRKALLPGRDDGRIEKLRAIGAVPFVRQKNEKRKK
jgi:hypothetical protein